MTRHVTRALVLTTVMAIAGCASAPDANAPADIAAVNAVRTAFQKAFNAGDAAAITNLYTADPISMGNHQPTATGRDAITAAHKAQFAAMSARIEITADETKTMGNWGFDRGHFRITLTPKAGGPVVKDEGRYVVLLQKGADGAWKVSRDIDNSSLALPTPPPPPPSPRPARPAAKGKAKGKTK